MAYKNNNQTKIRPACNILQFFKAIGGKGEYQGKKGILKCYYNEKIFIFRDFSKTVTIDGKNIKMQNEMKHMQENQPFAVVKDLCKITGKKYKVTKSRKMWSQFWESTRSIQSLLEVN